MERWLHVSPSSMLLGKLHNVILMFIDVVCVILIFHALLSMNIGGLRGRLLDYNLIFIIDIIRTLRQHLCMLTKPKTLSSWKYDMPFFYRNFVRTHVVLPIFFFPLCRVEIHRTIHMILTEETSLHTSQCSNWATMTW